MRIFTCSSCQQTVFFENVQCTRCGRRLAYLPDQRILSALEPAEADALFIPLSPRAGGRAYRLCRNQVEYGACNWLVAETDPHALCVACRMSEALPEDLEDPLALESWRKLERAKRRLLYTLDALGLPFESRSARPDRGLAFAFRADAEGETVLTGHADGLVTINLQEADDAHRERMRVEMGEAYRTLLGHFRHEVGHYYWDRLIKDGPWLSPFRALFGDERADYQRSLKRHYQKGPPADWQQSYVSAYSTMHPWEDWAETWAHYLHMVDTLDTARAYGMTLKPKPVDGPRKSRVVRVRSIDFEDFDALVERWVALTIALNGMNRSMGLNDPYPFVLSDLAVQKLRFVHDVVDVLDPDPADEVLKRWPQWVEAEPPVVELEEEEEEEEQPSETLPEPLPATADMDEDG
ncbi:MAG TPA: putative zinc-binding metallopeptidase [Polyangiales bacterium]|nr:putative zinc-binding metallopeptidase [Polyangiales bacterium]